MTFAAPDSIASGFPYAVVEIRGAKPSALDQFEGEAEFVLQGAGSRRVVNGSGKLRGDWIHFQEKDVSHDGKDVRVWQIKMHGSEFVAEHLAGG
jgi:hypothetical protein